MTWPWIAGGVLLAAAVWWLVVIVRKANERDASRQETLILKAEISHISESIKNDEKREDEHDKMVADIINDHHLSVDRINKLLNKK